LLRCTIVGAATLFSPARYSRMPAGKSALVRMRLENWPTPALAWSVTLQIPMHFALHLMGRSIRMANGTLLNGVMIGVI
jgi:hypothetical protein